MIIAAHEQTSLAGTHHQLLPSMPASPPHHVRNCKSHQRILLVSLPDQDLSLALDLLLVEDGGLRVVTERRGREDDVVAWRVLPGMVMVQPSQEVRGLSEQLD